ncbi:helix-turn-helix domain containing protein [Kitasatospora sp. NBC_01300]|uniref:helix-turn-helix domain containing protein n=1 Tax=Kitasatospora sp. NBC_01300 TaxID=2903574 RepID=UPI002F91463D|nr:helix-turn-helix domain containing protein [Kitasatospora sp. NBC_01300]
MSPADPNNPNEAARLTQELLDEGYTKNQVAKLLGRNASLVSQFFTKGKGASMVTALRQLVRAVRGGERDTEALAGIADQNIKRRTTKGGDKARVRGKDIIVSGTSMTGRAGRQAISTGASQLAKVVHDTGANPRGRLAFTVRMKANQFTMSPGSEKDSAGLKRGYQPRPDGTEERAYGDAQNGGLNAADWSQRVARHHGDVTEAVQEWLVETGRAVPDAAVEYLEVRGWVPRS